jgi:hypothetical protein
MGTRGLTAVQVDGKYMVAQYGQWDHNPSGQGVTALKFCRECLVGETRARFRSALARVRFSELDRELRSSTFVRDAKNGERYPYAGRDNGAEILDLILSAPDDQTIYLSDSISFVEDSLFCEWAYVVDLDSLTFEVFKGFNKNALGAGERFRSFDKSGGEYRPVHHVVTWKLDDLPSEEAFLRALKSADNDD